MCTSLVVISSWEGSNSTGVDPTMMSPSNVPCTMLLVAFDGAVNCEETAVPVHGGSPCIQYIITVLDVSELSSGKYEPLAQMNGLLKQEIKQVLSSIAGDPPKMVPSTMLSSGLSISLCYIQRCLRETSAGETLKPRILIIRADQDIALQHRAIMNCIFAAQKQLCIMDGVKLHTDLTGGTYIKIPEPAGLLQFLLWIFLPDIQTRSLLNLPSSALVDYRASCFCHNTLIDIGFVCSICLAVFVPICPVCQSHLKLPSLPSLKSKKKGKSSKQKNK